jgi:hypothetical protein
MRQENQHWDKIRIYVEMILAGNPQTGKTVKVKLKRLSDSNWWNHVGEVWGGAAVENTMVEVDATNEPGVYELALPSIAFSSYDLSFPGYRAYITESTKSLKESVLVVPLRRSPHDDIVTDHADNGTFGHMHQVAKSLVGGNAREKNQLYDLSKNLLTWTTVTYANATDADLDQNPLETFEGEATYTDGKLTSYVLKSV